MTLAERLSALENKPEIADPVKTKPRPAGWEPGVVWHGSNGEITTEQLYEHPSEWDDILMSRGLDPEKFEVVGDKVKWCSWDGWKTGLDGNVESAICYSFKAEIRKKVTVENGADYNLEELYREIRKTKKPKRAGTEGNDTLVIALSDWQVGNRDGGGVQAQVEAIARLAESIPQRITDLRRMGYKIGHLAVLGMGDLVEGTCGHYSTQQFRVEIDRRDQIKMVRRGIRDILVASAPAVEKVSVVAIPGNHGENRQNGRNITSVHDNDDVAVFEQVAEILAMDTDNRFSHIGFRLSRDEIALGLDVGGKIIAITHGHVTKPGANAGQALWNWWQNQAMGRAYPVVADADILISGHYHHLNVKEQENRAVFVCPSLTQVGEYFSDSYGVKTRNGTLSMVVCPDGWGELNLL